MRQINEELTGIEVSNLVTDEQEGETVNEQNGGSRKEARKQRVESTYRESGLEAEQSENILSESAEQVEHPDEDGDGKVYKGDKNINKDKNEDGFTDVNHAVLESQGDFQSAPSEPQNLPSSEAKGWMENLEFILDIPLQIDIQLGQTKIPLREVLEISSGSLIKLNKSENSPVELLINGKLVAEGQIVVTEENTLGVQVTSIVNRVERIRSLK